MTIDEASVIVGQLYRETLARAELRAYAEAGQNGLTKPELFEKLLGRELTLEEEQAVLAWSDEDGLQ
jgi:hypothetical protein